MNFYIKQNSILPNLKMKLYMDGRLDYKKFHDLLENATVTFSMKNIDNGTFKIINKESQIVEVQNGDNIEYYLQYNWNQNDTLESGNFEGQFRVDFLDECSYIIVPIREKLYINILSSFTKAEIEDNNNLIESDSCLIYCDEYKFTGGTVSGATEFLSDVNICDGDLYVHNILGCSPITINNNLEIGDELLTVSGDTIFLGNVTGNTFYCDNIFSGNTNLLQLFTSTDFFTTGSTFNSNTKIATFNRNDGNNYELDLSTLSTTDRYVTGFTYNNNILTIKQNENLNDLSVSINEFTGLTITSFSGSTSRLVEVDNNGNLNANKEIISAYISSGSTQSNLLDNTNNWDINGNYIGIPITETYQGQKYYNNNYFFEAVDDNLWIRLIRG